MQLTLNGIYGLKWVISLLLKCVAPKIINWISDTSDNNFTIEKDFL